MCFRLLPFLLLILTVPTIIAQDEDPPPIQPGEAQTVALDGDLIPTRLSYSGTRGEVIRVTVRDVSEGDPLDTVLEIRAPNGERLAYNDDHLNTDDALAQTDSRIAALILPMDGVYIIHVDSYGGIFEGEAEVLLEQIDLYDADIRRDSDRTTITATLPRHLTYRYEVEITTETALTITVRDLSGGIDPRFELANVAGEIVADNDDHDSGDLSLDVFDSQATVTLSPGVYTLTVLDFLGREGKVEVVLEFGT